MGNDRGRNEMFFSFFVLFESSEGMETYEIDIYLGNSF